MKNEEIHGTVSERHYYPSKMQIALSTVGGSVGSTLAVVEDTSFAVATIVCSV